MFRTIVSTMDRDKDYPQRQFTIDVYSRVLDGALYSHLPNGFHDEQNSAGEYVPLRSRRPSVQFNLCRLVVDDSVSLLFSEGHFPTPQSEDKAVADALALVIKHAQLNEVMLEAATTGAVGSVAIHMKVLRQGDGSHRLFFEPRCTEYLTPDFDPKCPDRLLKIVERYKVRGEDLDESYDIPRNRRKSVYWFRREWDDKAETWFLPQLVADADKGDAPVKDAGRTVAYEHRFVPWVWVKNLPGKLRYVNAIGGGPGVYSAVDGACTFAAAVETMIEADYQLSQSGRGLKYSMDPLLLIKEPAASPREFVKSPANALVTSEKGDASLLEISGSAFGVVLDYVRALRELALETIHGNKADSQKLSTAQSGRAMELMNQALVWLADRLRVSYGEGALLSLLRMTLQANAVYPITLADGTELGKLNATAPISLKWPDWYAPTADDRQCEAITLKTHTDAGHLSQETAVKTIAGEYDIEDVPAELARIKADEAARVAIAATKQQINVNA